MADCVVSSFSVDVGVHEVSKTFSWGTNSPFRLSVFIVLADYFITQIHHWFSYSVPDCYTNIESWQWWKWNNEICHKLEIIFCCWHLPKYEADEGNSVFVFV
jgi:hypothetical protein